jgi:hypothetical protein
MWYKLTAESPCQLTSSEQSTLADKLDANRQFWSPGARTK